MTIKSERLLLRNLCLNDAPDMFEFTSQPEVSQFLTWEYHKSIKDDERFIESCMANDSKLSYHIGIELVEERKLIGCIHVYGVSLLHKRAEISFIISPTFQGMGYGTEAVNTLIDNLFCQGFIRVQALCIPQNSKSEKLMIRCGMNKEGILRNYAILKDGRNYPMILYSICNYERLKP